jgi:hypothetical protein
MRFRAEGDMIPLNLYYIIKPAIPHGLRLRLRSLLAARQRRRSAAVWPINPSAASPPEWWRGWREGRKFAFVLTHDVEGQKGLAQCKALAELERSFGFRSSFNFVPEGEYDTPASLRHFLEDGGFEVGVHDLHHDGTLYRSESGFTAAAIRINRYLRDWEAVGFRSGFMFHNLEWLKQLDILYDASTFDTDPLEPQSDGANTIFPFWVQRSNGSGYVELPYSLPQDSTLYLVLREKTNDIWKRKLDWVAERGGMALVNVHPDYIAFDGPAGRTQFPAALYRDFLAYVSARYGDAAWCALPRDVAHFVKDTLFATASKTAETSRLAEMKR